MIFGGSVTAQWADVGIGPYRQVGKCGARPPKDFCFSPLPAATSQALRASSP